MFEITPETLDAAERSVAPGRRIYMLNLLRYRSVALYEDGQPPCAGREAFHGRYVPAFRRLAAGKQVARRFAGAVLANIVAPERERWDDVALNEYADFATFRAIVDTDAYRREVQPHRIAALEDFRLYMTAEND